MIRTQLHRPIASSQTAASAETTAIEIRPTRLDDEERVRDFLTGLSLHTQTLRFFTGITRPNATLVHALLARDDRRDALLAVRREQVIGHAMSFRDDRAAEIAVVVADEWQGRGVGAWLVDRLLLRAAALGALDVGMDIMGENRKVLGMVRRRWPNATVRVQSGTVEVRARIPG